VHVTAFTSAGQALIENDAASVRGLPMTWCPVSPHLPLALMVPVVVSMWAEAGEDIDPHYFIMGHDADGELRGRVERLWHWPDLPGKPYKFHVFTEYLHLMVKAPGFYKIGYYEHPDQAETDLWFPLEVIIDPSAPPPQAPPPSAT
jgi:hypothetical protein